ELGSGFGRVVEAMDPQRRIPYRDIPGLPVPTVPGHAGEVVFGMVGDVAVVALSGRAHLYEGHAAAQVAEPVRFAASLGVTTFIATNASGGVATDLRVGDVVVLDDHLYFPGLAGNHPLIGLAEGERFVAMDRPYDAELQAIALSCLTSVGVRAREGVYAMVAGPSYETRAEIRFLRAIGADVVGMSAIPEVIVARQLGMRVLALSLVTNSHAASSMVSHADVLAEAAAAGERLARALRTIVTLAATTTERHG
ncbi:MAG: purine-nucleoside phosphorylase, partial [Dehalococcoidia bacterium]|nr:purine-nucleoside phosphorylase [Dehalococcoidia bacterium]